ncbi:MAG: pyridoxamine kinase [Clostridia bacterium]|nr:pyridoxamine kinase [Clostridia bacterium]
MQRSVLAVHDLSCVGRCSLTVALPILSAAGINTAVIPTTLLSTHTGEFVDYTRLDLSHQLLPIAQHLAKQNLHFDALYSGYLASSDQVQKILQIIDLLADPSTLLLVDPAFADYGKMYTSLDDSHPNEMRRLCARAHTIVPNLTEAAFLLGDVYPGNHVSPAYVGELAKGLSALGPKNVIITGISFEQSRTGIAVYQNGMEEPVYNFTHRCKGTFHGTGDVYASFLLAALLSGKPFIAAAALAMELTYDSIRLTLAEGQPLRFGVQFERVLPKLLASLDLLNPIECGN